LSSCYNYNLQKKKKDETSARDRLKQNEASSQDRELLSKIQETVRDTATSDLQREVETLRKENQKWRTMVLKGTDLV
jgi:hypothetical protein